jgi:hypothetical protein
LDRCHEVGQEHADIGIAGIERQPCGPPPRTLGREPLRQQGGLAEPGGGSDQQQPRHLASVGTQPVGEPGPLHQPATRPGRAQLGGQHRHRSGSFPRVYGEQPSAPVGNAGTLT